MQSAKPSQVNQNWPVIADCSEKPVHVAFLAIKYFTTDRAFKVLISEYFNQVFHRKTPVIKIMNVGGRAVGRASVNISFPEHNSATVSDILMILGMIIGQCGLQMQEWQICLSWFSNYLPLSIFVLSFWPVSQ